MLEVSYDLVSEVQFLRQRNAILVNEVTSLRQHNAILELKLQLQEWQRDIEKRKLEKAEAKAVLDKQQQEAIEMRLEALETKAALAKQQQEALQTVLPEIVAECEVKVRALFSQWVGAEVQVLPQLYELRCFLEGEPYFPDPQKSVRMSIPVLALRWTHQAVNGSLAFADGRSIFGLFERLFRGTLAPEKVEPLHVYIHTGTDGVPGLYSRSNRRLLALMMFQATQRDVLVCATCNLYSRPDGWFQHGYDGGDGLSTRVHPGVSTHYDIPLFKKK